MKSLWNDTEANEVGTGDVARRIYTSRLLGREPSLVLHGGGNTSVKTTVTDRFGVSDEILYVKGSGGDLATITEKGFAPVRMDILLKMARLESLTDTEMVRMQRAAMIDPGAPNPSVEAILHALIPFKFVDHTHADAVVAITNTPGGETRIREIYGSRVLIVPYVMPGFVLARAIGDQTHGVDWAKLQGMVLLGHGVFTFGDDARTSYERMITLVTAAEEYIAAQGASSVATAQSPKPVSMTDLARLRRAASDARGAAMLASADFGEGAAGYAGLSNVEKIAGQGTLTPDHIIRTKRVPVIVAGDPKAAVETFALDYRAYFARHNPGHLTMLDPAPRWAVWPGAGTVTFGRSFGEANIAADIIRHTVRAQQWAENLGGWRALPEADLFEMEYWELEQAKLKASGGSALPLQGRIALVTGAASGIGKAAAEALMAQGAVVAALDIVDIVPYAPRSENGDPFPVPPTGGKPGSDWILPIKCDVTDRAQVSAAIELTVRACGGLDIVVSNAGTFPPSIAIADMDPDVWRRSLEINLSSHQYLLQATVPYLELGWEPSVVIVGSKNVPAPGPGVAAYSVAKAGLNQLARVAALEWAPKGIRVNSVHPNAVFDTAIWTPEVLEKRARHYGLSVEEYKTNNLLHVEVTSRDVAASICALAGPTFSRTTGAQIPIDGGNDRVI